MKFPSAMGSSAYNVNIAMHEPMQVSCTYIYTCITKSQLPANHCTVRSAKKVLTNGAPDIVMADLHSAFVSVVTVDKPHISFSAISYGKAKYQLGIICMYILQINTQ